MGSNGENRGDVKYKYTAKELQVIEAFISGMNKSDAYRQGYKMASRWTKKTVNEKASRFFAQDKVKTRIDKINEKIENKIVKKALWSKEKATDELLEVLECSKEDKSYSNSIGAIKELNTLNACYPKDDSFMLTPESIAQYLRKLTPEQIREVLSNV